MIGSLVKLAVAALWANKLRSGLTFLGVVVGFTSVMTIISALEGMMGSIEKDLARLGPSTFIVSRIGGIITSHEQWLEMNKRKGFDPETAKLIMEGCDLCKRLAKRSSSHDATIKYGNTTMRDIYVDGGTYNLVDIVDIEVAQGRFHSFEDDLYRRRVVFIGDLIREKFFEGVDPVGKTIRIDGTRYTVIGVAKKRGTMMGQNQDNFAFVPFSTHIKQYGYSGKSIRYMIEAKSVEDLDDTMDQVRMILRANRHVPYDKPDDFNLLTADNILEMLNSVTRLFRMSLIGISSISLVVGGIVIMNIMMVSVTERTREIGIRKAVGARQRHILLQFLFEALITTLSGGMIGIVAGYIIAESLVGMIDMDISPSTFAILAGLSISVGIGVIFGIYPAMKAARLDPIKALSYE
ncbi:MAG: ABC transporter permease [candidate division Zixibacteria bacterium]|nr:ABC transporter permease [candidate division Zixibacteria bacterium]